jgi:hypothetical protein
MATKLKIEKRGDEIKKKIFSSETTEPISTKLCQGSFHQSLVAIGPVVSEEKIKM